MHKRLLGEAILFTIMIVILFGCNVIKTTNDFWEFTGWYVLLTFLLMALSKKVTPNEQN